jgi:hypothetical protein
MASSQKVHLHPTFSAIYPPIIGPEVYVRECERMSISGI